MERIRQLRKAKGLSQAKLAVMADMDPATLNRLEQGKGNPNIRTLERVAGALGVEVADLLGKASAPPSLEPTLFNGLQDERRSPIVHEAVSDVAEKWHQAVSNPDARPYEISAAVDAGLALGEALMERFGAPSVAGYSAEQWEVVRLAARLLEISKAGNDRMLARGEAEQVEQRREQIRELTRRISA